MHKYLAVTLGAFALTVGLAACGGSSSSSTASSAPPASTTSSTPASTPPASSTPASSGAASTLSDAADPSGALKFTKSSLTAKAGKVKVSFTNMSPLMHNMTIVQGTNGAQVGATPTFSGATKTFEVTLKPGTYTFFCSVPGHRAAGMQGTITVS
jgi:plastocyanin